MQTITSIRHNMAHFPVVTMLQTFFQDGTNNLSIPFQSRVREGIQHHERTHIQFCRQPPQQRKSTGLLRPLSLLQPCTTKGFVRKGAKWDIGNPSATNSPFSRATKSPGYINNLKIRATATNSEMRRPLNDKVSNLGKENNCINEATSASADSGIL